MTKSSAITLPTCQIISLAVGTDYSDLQLRATDESGIYQITYKVDGVSQTPQKNPERHPTSDTYASPTVRIYAGGKTSVVVRVSAQDQGGNIANEVASTIVFKPQPATTPNPPNGSTGRSISQTLSWANGGGAISYDVYFGTSNPPSSKGNQTGTTYNPGTLAYATTYYWRIDTKNSAGTTTGDVWSFTTQDTPPHGTLQFSSATYSVSENGGTVTIMATRTGGSYGTASVNYATANETAIAGSDYTSKNGTLNRTNGDAASKTITVSIMDDAVYEGNETFAVNLSGASGASLGSPASATVTIVDDEYTVTFDAQGGTAPSPASKSVTYGSTYGTLATTARAGYSFAGWWTVAGGGGTEVTAATTVTITTAQTLYAKWTVNSYTVTFDAQGGTAPSPASKSVTYGSTYGTLATTTRAGYTFGGWWTAASGGGTEVTGATTVTITANQTLYAKWIENHGTLQLSATTYSVNENGGSVTITATRTDGSAGAATVNYATANGTALAGSDYTTNSGLLNWADGDTTSKTFTVTILDDAVYEGNETFTVNLSGVTGASLGSPASATVTMVDDEPPPPTLTVTPANQSVAFAAGITTFVVTNTGGGTMSYTNSEAVSWFSITSGGSGGNSGTITVSYDANTGTTARTGTITVTALGASGSPTNVTVIQTPNTTPILSVTPDNQAVGSALGTTTFAVTNTGGGTMSYTNSEAVSWLSITSGGSGGNSGTITVSYVANPGTTARTGTITVTASGASGSPKSVTVTQAGKTDFIFTINSPDTNTVTIIGYTGSGGAIAIPSTIDWKTVINIGSNAFRACTSMTSVSITNSVTSIGTLAFYGCPNLTSVTLPDSVTNIGDYAFCNCASLTSITVDAGNTAYSSLAGILFNKNQTILIQCPGGKIGNYTIPNSVTSFGVQAFAGCIRLTSVAIPNSVTDMGSWTFVGCTNLTGVTIGNGITSIGEYSFYCCASLTSVWIPHGVANIGDLAFAYCAGMNKIIFKGNVPNVGANVFIGANNVTVYYMQGTTGWGTTFGGRPTAPWATSNTSQGTPCLWLDQYWLVAGSNYEGAALADVDGDGHAAWQEYVAGTVPTNRKSAFRSVIVMSNGSPWVTWTPDLGTARVYTVEGRSNLVGGIWGTTNAGSRFFRVKVGLP